MIDTDRGSTPSSFFDRVRFRGQPLANPESIITCGKARFTVLTSRLLRLEWASDGVFEDRATYAFPCRAAPAPPFTVSSRGGKLRLATGALVLDYFDDSRPFSSRNLSIGLQLNGRRVLWTPGTKDPGNLRGTRRTLDGCSGEASLEPGLVSRSGWSLVDDTKSVVFDPVTGWVQARPRHDALDWYFLGYGHDYQGALADYVKFGGATPLIPRFALGAWWSRYWAYSAQDLMDLVQEFEAHDLPLDVLVVDMDWHTPHSWTGYSWNLDLFPDPKGFLDWAHDKGLRVTLNLHPAQGVQPFEDAYPRFAEVMGLDAELDQPIPFRVTDPRFIRYYFELLHHPIEDEGVDFWWLDWQQGETSDLPGLDPLPWLNHLHFSDSARRGQRPLLYSRWGGLGNHRYPIGFSGDTYVTWESLRFQPIFTATATNVAFGWWSHDIGGHMGGATDPELFARWVQFGALSPVLRLHATKDPRAERRPWKYPDGVFRAAHEAFRLRYQLVPYFYTLARVATDTGLSPCRPMYYPAPESADAYAARHQFLLGDSIIAAPIVSPADPETGLASTDVWCPEGTWFDYQTKESHEGPRWIRLVGDIQRLPLLIKAGTILPLAPGFEPHLPPRMSSGTTDALPRDRLVLACFPGADGRFRLYEDDGVTLDYQRGEFEWTEFTTSGGADGRWNVTISNAQGNCPELPSTRAYEIRLEGSQEPHTVLLNGQEIQSWTYDAESLQTVIHVPRTEKRESLSIEAIAPRPAVALLAAHNRRMVRRDVVRLVGAGGPAPARASDLADFALGHTDRPGFPDAIARLGGPFVSFLEFSTLEEASNSLGQVIVAGPTEPGEAFDLRLVTTLESFGRRDQQAMEFRGLSESQILDLPFTFDGRARPLRWESEVKLTWRCHSWMHRHQSQPLFPTIPLWKVLIWDESRAPLMIADLLNGARRLSETAKWRVCAQQPGEMSSLRQPHHIRFQRGLSTEMEAAEAPVAYLLTSLVSPRKRDAVLELGIAGNVEVHLNGHRVELLPPVEEPGVFSFFRQPRRSRRLQLQEGGNSLLIKADPPIGKAHTWFVVASVLDDRGQPLVDLDFSLPGA